MNQSLRPSKYDKPVVRDMTESLGKIPPQALDLEEAILGALMLERNALLDVIDFLHVEHFYSDAHSEIYKAITELFKESNPVDMRTVVSKLRKNGKLEVVGGAYAIAELTSKISSAANIEYHARVVVEYAIKRSLIQIASKIHHDSYEDTVDALELLNRSQRDIDLISGNILKGNSISVSMATPKVVDQIKKRRNSTGITGIASGLHALDELTGGFQNTELITIAARPGMAKTATMIAMARSIGIHQQIPCGIFSIEMASDELIERIISAETMVNLGSIRKGKLTDKEIMKLDTETGHLAGSKIYIDDSASLSIMEFRVMARRWVQSDGVKIIFVDYLQLMNGDKTGNREREISSISIALKATAKELKIPIVALAQLSREVEKRPVKDRRPKLADIRESGSIEQDSNVVMFLYRPEYYKQKQYEDGRSTAGALEIIIAKNRSGPLGIADVNFVGEQTLVKNIQTVNEIPFGSTKKNEIPGDDLPF